MKKFFGVAALAVTILAGTLPASAGALQYLGCTWEEKTCIILDNNGLTLPRDTRSESVIPLALQAAAEVKARGVEILVLGACPSFCSLVVDYARSNTCVGPNARIRFHYFLARSNKTGLNREESPPYSRDIADWIRKQEGGLPSNRSGELLTLWAGWPGQTSFWKKCSSEESRPYVGYSRPYNMSKLSPR